MTHNEVWTGASDGWTPIQESDEKKSRWLTWAEAAFPPGATVRVVGGDVTGYIGAIGTVRGYDVGHKGEWPLVSIELRGQVDSFYCDGSDAEIVRLDPLTECAHERLQHSTQDTGAAS